MYNYCGETVLTCMRVSKKISIKISIDPEIIRSII